MGEWLRVNALKMSKTFNTQAFYWVDIRLSEFTKWIRAGNTIIDEENAEIEKARKKRRQ